MKAYITGMFFQTAVGFVESAQKAHDEGWVPDEARQSLGAHVMCAFVLEGVINEVGESVLSSGIWDKVEKIETSLKWLFVSHYLNGGPFTSGGEPLQTVADLQRVRNRLAHPKAMDLGREGIVRNRDGNVIRQVADDYILQEGDAIFAGFGNLIDEFNAVTARKAVNRTNAALQALKKKTSNTIEWVRELESWFPWLKPT